ncbi:hypothetical protein [Burkholderia ambifaria]|uniref:hypothetical protein n=1 Tax=Burkholderia ambifaria TaxID=152480 RepID=UPI001589E747|nr:hypothetical protein [Burkholderia ambifaria]
MSPTGADACANAETDAKASAAVMIEASVFFIVLPLAEKKSNVPVRDARHPHRDISGAGLTVAAGRVGFRLFAAANTDALGP